MVDYLLSITNRLYECGIDDAQKNGERMSSVLTILCSLYYAIIPKYVKMEEVPYNSMSRMLSMLHLMPDVAKRECMDYDYLIRSIPVQFRKFASESLIGFIVYLSHKKHFHEPKWLYSVPLGHFLYEASKPFEGFKFNLDPKKIQFGDKIFGFAYIKNVTSGKNYKYVYYLYCNNLFI